MGIIKYGKVFSDWLSVSFPTSVSPYSEILSFLDSVSLPHEIPRGGKKTLYQYENSGTLQTITEDAFHNYSFSGGLLSSLRSSEAHREFILALTSNPSNVTRLDATLDLPVPTSLVMRNIDRAHKDQLVRIAGRPRKIQYITDSLTGDPTGTMYFQQKSYSGYVHLCIYDKSKELREQKGIEVPPTTRYELRVYKGASMRDYADPTSLFWHYMPESILPKPKDVLVPSWNPTERISYDSVTKPISTDYESLKALIQNSGSLKALVQKAQSVPGGDHLLHNELAYALGIRSRRDEASKTW